jgi:hypothetical protein
MYRPIMIIAVGLRHMRVLLRSRSAQNSVVFVNDTIPLK